MASVSIQDIEAVDDYWGPTFRSILESNSSDALSEQLDARIRSHDKDIERICNQYYQGFIESARELLHVRTQAASLKHEVHDLDRALTKETGAMMQRGFELVQARQIEGNIASAIEGLGGCLPVLECYVKLKRQVSDKRYYPALKTLEQLERDHLPTVAGYRFAAQMKEAVPQLKENIKRSSEADFREFLENIRSFTPKIGHKAIEHTKQQQKRDLASIIEGYYAALAVSNASKLGGSRGGTTTPAHRGRGPYTDSKSSADDADDDLNALDDIDFSPIYRCLQIYSVFGDKEFFEKDYQQQRQDQAKLVLQAPPAMHDNLDAYAVYISSIVGFFIVEEHIMATTAGDVMTRQYLDDLWSGAVSKAVQVLSMSSASCTDPNILLKIKNLIMLSITTLKTYGFAVAPLWELLFEMRDHYNEVLLQRWVNEFREILDSCEFKPLEVADRTAYDAVLDAFPFHSEQLERGGFPKRFPFSGMVPDVYHKTKEFMYACMKFSEELTLAPQDVAVMVRKAANLLLTRSFSGCLSAVFRKPTLTLMQVVQIIIDTQYLEKAGPFLDDFVAKVTGTQQEQKQQPSAMFHTARAEAEQQVAAKLCEKLDDFDELGNYDWLLAEPTGRASPFINDMIAYLKSTFQSFSYLLPMVAAAAYHKACQHIAQSFYKLLLSDEVKQISTGALQQISLDLMQFEEFDRTEPVPGLKEPSSGSAGALRHFVEVQQLLELLISEEWSAYLHDYGKSDNRYNLVRPETIIVVLEKVREGDKRTMFSVLKKSERDKKKLWETVLRQLKQLAERNA